MRDSNTLKVLIRARQLLARPYGWTKKMERRRARGKIAYCAIGAINQASRKTRNREHYRLSAMHQLSCTLPGLSLIADWNDSPTTKKQDIIAAFDRAIEDLESTL